jgi:4-hydroxy-tetrahydrodipicolinate reductase
VGLALPEFERRVAEKQLRHVGLGESLHFLAHYLGWRIERWEETIAPVVAERAETSGLGPVSAGAARGVRQEARAWVGGRPAIELLFQATVGEEAPRDRVVIEGEPSFELVAPGGVHGDTGTSALVLNVIRSLVRAEPGLHTMASLPIQGCAAPEQ